MKKLTTILIIGAAAGAAAYWLLKTEKGKQVLGSIKDASGDLADKVKSGLNTVKDTTVGVVEKSKKYIANMNNNVQEAAN